MEINISESDVNVSKITFSTIRSVHFPVKSKKTDEDEEFKTLSLIVTPSIFKVLSICAKT